MERLTERHVQAALRWGAGAQALSGAFTPDYDFKLKLVLKCHLTLIDYEDRTMGSAEA